MKTKVVYFPTTLSFTYDLPFEQSQNFFNFHFVLQGTVLIMYTYTRKQKRYSHTIALKFYAPIQDKQCENRAEASPGVLVHPLVCTQQLLVYQHHQL